MNTFLLNSKVTLDSDGNVLSELLYVYDENNNLIDIREPETPSNEPSFPSFSDTEYIYIDYISNNLSNFALENNGDAVFYVFEL